MRLSAGGGVRIRRALLLDLTPRSGWFHMAADRGLVDRVAASGEAYLRLYRWAPHCLSFGRHEPALRRYDRARIAALGLDVVRRPTGGRAVWHAGELTYALVAPAAWLGSPAEAYLAIHRCIAEALASLGAVVTLAPRPDRSAPVDAGACFARPAGGEVLIGGRKVVGSAQLKHGDVLLQHGSILIDDDQEMVRQVTAGHTASASAPASELPLARALGRPVGADTVAAALVAAMAMLGGAWAPADPVALDSAAEPHAGQFRSPDWTWSR